MSLQFGFVQRQVPEHVLHLSRLASPRADAWIVPPLDSDGTRTIQFIKKPDEQTTAIYLHLLHSQRRRSRVPAFSGSE